ncbi:hypothetical protein [Sphingobacterium siyangense]|uniref:hypothetical protein n=1 Tax=Sphingobacterium siyangense TaxID=459529 RepID=UPI002FD8D64D
MTSYKDSFIESETHLLGVCFKPAAFANFYKYEPQKVLINDTIEFEKSNSFELDKVLLNPIDYFNRLYSDKIVNKTNLLQGVLNDINSTHGQIGISALSNVISQPLDNLKGASRSILVCHRKNIRILSVFNGH